MAASLSKDQLTFMAVVWTCLVNGHPSWLLAKALCTRFFAFLRSTGEIFAWLGTSVTTEEFSLLSLRRGKFGSLTLRCITSTCSCYSRNNRRAHVRTHTHTHTHTHVHTHAHAHTRTRTHARTHEMIMIILNILMSIIFSSMCFFQCQW